MKPQVDVVINADTRPFAAGLQQAKGQLGQFLTAGAIVNAIRSTLQFGDALGDLALKAGVSVEWLQKAGFAASQAGSSVEELSNAVTELGRSVAEAGRGDNGAIRAFETLGISVRDLKTLSIEEIFDRIAAAVQKSGGDVVDLDAAIQLLGRSGKGLIPTLVDGFEQMKNQAEELGVVLDKSAVKSLGTMNDLVDQIILKTKVNAATLVALLKPVLAVAMAMDELIHGGLRMLKGDGFKEAAQQIQQGFERAWKFLRGDGGRTEAQTDAVKRSALLDGRQSPAKPESDGLRSAPTAPSRDPWGRAGLFTGVSGPGVSMVSLQRQTIRELRAIRQAVDRNTTETKIDW